MWTTEYCSGLPDSLPGASPSIVLAPGRILSHAFRQPRVVQARPGQPMRGQAARLSVSIDLSTEAEIDGNPGREEIPADSLPQIAIILKRSWGDAPGNRWYARRRLLARPGRQSLTIPLVAEQWQGVYGELPETGGRYYDAWRRAFRAPAELGVCFGSHFFGHGWGMARGAATITLHGLRIA